MRLKLRAPSAALALASTLAIALPGGPARAQWIVYDPANFGQNVLTAAHTLEQINNQIHSLQNEAQMILNQGQMLLNQGKNLASLVYSPMAMLQQDIARTQALIAQAQGLATQVTQLDQQFRQQYPTSYGVNTSIDQTVADARTRWNNSLEALRTTLELQGQVNASIAADTQTLSTTVGSSQSAVGILQAVQATNQAGQPMLDEIGKLAGFTSVFTNIDTIVVLFIAWIIVVVSFFVLAVQLFVSVLEFKLTTLAGFVLVPFALWGKTSFLAEKVLGNVVSSGIKILVLAIIVGIGTGLFTQFQSAAGTTPTISQALAVVLGAISLLGLGIFGPGIANGLVSGAPQLGAGAAVGAAAAGTGLLVASGAGAVAAGRVAGGTAMGGMRAATSMASGARSAYGDAAAASGASGLGRAGAGMAGVAHAGASAAGDGVRSAARRAWTGASAGKGSGDGGEAGASSGSDTAPRWARNLRGSDAVRRGVETAAHAVRSGDHGGSGAGPKLETDEA